MAQPSPHTFASMWIVDLGWTPRQVLIEILAELTVETLRVMLTDTPSMDLEQRRQVK